MSSNLEKQFGVKPSEGVEGGVEEQRRKALAQLDDLSLYTIYKRISEVNHGDRDIASKLGLDDEAMSSRDAVAEMSDTILKILLERVRARGVVE